jgi:hypothetical protein
LEGAFTSSSGSISGSSSSGKSDNSKYTAHKVGATAGPV